MAEGSRGDAEALLPSPGHAGASRHLLNATPPPLTHLMARLCDNRLRDWQVSRAGHPDFGCGEGGPPRSKQSGGVLGRAAVPGAHPAGPREQGVSGAATVPRGRGPGQTLAMPCPWGCYQRMFLK